MATYRFQNRDLTAGQSILVDEILAVLPALAGSEKQVSWACDLRRKAAINTVMLRMPTKAEDASERAKIVATFGDVGKCAPIHTTDAKRWIDSDIHNANLPTLIDLVTGKVRL